MHISHYLTINKRFPARVHCRENIDLDPGIPFRRGTLPMYIGSRR